MACWKILGFVLINIQVQQNLKGGRGLLLLNDLICSVLLFEFSGSFASSMEPELRDLEESNSSKGGWLSSLMKRSKESEESRDSGVHVKPSPSPARTKSRDSTGAESAEGSKSDKHGSYEDIKFV